MLVCIQFASTRDFTSNLKKTLKILKIYSRVSLSLFNFYNEKVFSFVFTLSVGEIFLYSSCAVHKLIENLLILFLLKEKQGNLHRIYWNKFWISKQFTSINFLLLPPKKKLLLDGSINPCGMSSTCVYLYMCCFRIKIASFFSQWFLFLIHIRTFEKWDFLLVCCVARKYKHLRRA